MAGIGIQSHVIDKTYTDEVATIPDGTTLDGTMDGDGTVITGTDTDFSQISKGDFLYYNGELKEITAVFSPKFERLDIKTAFTGDPSGADVVVCKNGAYKSVSLFNQGGADGTVNGETFKAGTARPYESNDGLNPIVIDASGTEFSAKIQY